MSFSKFIFGKTYTDNNGYERFRDSGNLVHRWVAEKYILGRKLGRKEVVHHKDRNKQNNHPSNLHIFPNQREHDEAHAYDAARFGSKNSYAGFKNTREKQGFWDWLGSHF
jgi:hypothetical protein